ncbi:MAG: RC-LH1 core complex protein PufX [Paracoccaceae bacterium]
MSDHFSFEPSRKAKMFLWVATEMGRGAGWALMICTIIIVALLAIRGVSYLLPEASQEAPPPMGALTQPLLTAYV